MKRAICAMLLALLLATLVLPVVLAAPHRQQATGRDPAKEQPIYDRLIKISASAVPVFQEATRAMDSGDLAAARQGYERVLTMAPDFPDALRRLSYVLRGQKDSAGAVRAARRAYEIDSSPYNAEALALALLEPGDTNGEAEALKLAQGAANAQQNDAGTQNTWMLAAAANGDETALGIATDRLIKLEPDYPLAHFYAGLLAADRSQWGRAEAEMLRSRELGMPPDVVKRVMDENNISLMARLWRGAGSVTYAVVAWVVLMGALFLAGGLLSAATLRGVRRPHPQPSYRPGFVDRALRGVYSGVIGLAAAYFYLSIPLLVILVAALMVGSLYAFFRIGRLPLQLIAFIVVAGGSTMYVLVRSVLAHVKEVEPGKLLAREQAPSLWALAEEVGAHVGTRPIDVVYLTGDAGIAVTERGSLFQKLRGRGQRCLILGIASLNGLTQHELRGILAHEYGHFSNRDTAGGNVAWHVRVSLNRIAYSLATKGLARKYNPAWLFLQGFLRVFLRITLGASRLQEILADRHAAVAYGVHNFTTALQRTIRQDLAFDLQVNVELEQAVLGCRRLNNLYVLPPIDGTALQPDLDTTYAKVMGRPTSAYDSHPAAAERIRLIEQMEVSIRPLGGDGPAADLLPNAEAWQQEFTAEAQKRVTENYGDPATMTDKNAQLYAYNQRLNLARIAHDRAAEGAMLCGIGDVLSGAWKKRESLAYYEMASEAHKAAGNWSGQAHVFSRRAATYEDLEEPQEALRYYESALGLYREVGDTAGESQVRYNIAMILEERGDLEGAELHLQRVIELEEACQDPDLPEDRAALERVHQKAEQRRHQP